MAACVAEIVLVVAGMVCGGALRADAQDAAQAVIEEPVVEGTTLTVKQKVGAMLYVYVLPKAKARKIQTCKNAETTFPEQEPFVLTGSGATTVTLKTKLAVGDQVCVAEFDPVTATPVYSGPVTVVTVAQANASMTFGFAEQPKPGSTIRVNGPVGGELYVYVHAKDPLLTQEVDCTRATLAKLPTPKQLSLKGPMPQTVRLSTALVAGDAVCLVVTSEANPEGEIAPVAVVSEAGATLAPPPVNSHKQPSAPVFVQRVTEGQTTVWVSGDPGASLELYSFAATPQPAKMNSCEDNLQNGKMLATTRTSDPTDAEARFVTVASARGNTEISLENVLPANRLLCVVETELDGTKLDSGYQSVAYKPDYGRVAVNLTTGAMIDNQMQTANSGSTTGSSAAEYVYLVINFNWMQAGGKIPAERAKAAQREAGTAEYSRWKPGLDTFISTALTSLPVSAPVNVTTTANTNATQTLNAMSAPQSVDFSAGFTVYWRTTRFFHSSNSFLAGPIGKAGFDTVLNPGSVSSVTGSGGTVLQTTEFSPVYSYEEAGVRIAWADISPRLDEAPRLYSAFSLSVGKYSYLPSYVCGEKPYGPLILKPTTTSCYLPEGNRFQLDASRTVIPRLRMEGFLRLPDYPFVIGMDANLGQYSVGDHSSQVDIQSKPGNDVRVYIGLTLDPTTALKKLGVENQ